MFENGGNQEVYASSADLMSRNMFRRVEVGFPIESKRLKQRILDDLDCYLQDNSQAWLMQSDGSYVQCVPEDDVFRVQNKLMEQYSVK